MEINELPFWAQNVLNVNQAFEIQRLMLKIIEESDLSKQQNRILLDKENREFYIDSYLTTEEAAEAKHHRTINEKEKGKSKAGEIGSSSSSASGMEEGLNVSVYVQGGWMVELQLKLFVGRERETYLQGTEMELLRVFSGLKASDSVVIWMFRRPDSQNKKGKICFLVVKL